MLQKQYSPYDMYKGIALDTGDFRYTPITLSQVPGNWSAIFFDIAVILSHISESLIFKYATSDVLKIRIKR